MTKKDRKELEAHYRQLFAGMSIDDKCAKYIRNIKDDDHHEIAWEQFIHLGFDSDEFDIDIMLAAGK